MSRKPRFHDVNVYTEEDVNVHPEDDVNVHPEDGVNVHPEDDVAMSMCARMMMTMILRSQIKLLTCEKAGSYEKAGHVFFIVRSRTVQKTL